MKKLTLLTIIIGSLVFAPMLTSAHSGGTDSSGCHVGHCHGSGGGGGGLDLSLGGIDQTTFIVGAGVVIVGITALAYYLPVNPTKKPHPKNISPAYRGSLDVWTDGKDGGGVVFGYQW